MPLIAAGSKVASVTEKRRQDEIEPPNRAASGLGQGVLGTLSIY